VTSLILKAIASSAALRSLSIRNVIFSLLIVSSNQTVLHSLIIAIQRIMWYLNLFWRCLFLAYSTCAIAVIAD
jgi:hypothetical protein